MSDKTLVQHMAEVMKEVGYVQKDGKLEAFPYYTYATAEKVYEKVRNALSEREIAVCGDAELAASEIVTTQKGPRHIVVVKHTLTFTDGTDSLSVSALGEGFDAGDKATAKANTIAVKYCLAKAFLISWGDDPESGPQNDGDEEEDDFREAITRWTEACEAASNTTAVKFAPWWKVNGDKVKADCGTEGAAQVHEVYSAYLKRLKSEAADASP